MKISLAEFVGEVGQAKAADAIGVHQTAISKAIRVGRQIFITDCQTGKLRLKRLSLSRTAKPRKHRAL